MKLPASAAKALARWPKTVAGARGLQERLRDRVIRRAQTGEVNYVAGTDVGFEKGGAVARAAVVVLEFPSLAAVDRAVACTPVRFPYVPGYLSFREIPALVAAFVKLRIKPDLILCDGQGFAHPRRFGLACHLGVLLDLPSIGVAKSRLVGEHDTPPPARGNWVKLRAGGETIGAVLRTRRGAKPLYISIGHRIGLESAIAYVLTCAPRYRLPETTRLAHRLASGRP